MYPSTRRHRDQRVPPGTQVSAGGAIFAITTTTLLRNAGVLPRILTIVAYLFAAFLLLAVTDYPAAVLVFPAWVVLASVLLLGHACRAAAGFSGLLPVRTPDDTRPSRRCDQR